MSEMAFYNYKSLISGSAGTSKVDDF